MSSIFGDITKSIQNIFSGQKGTPVETTTFKPSPYAVPAEFVSLEQTYFNTDPFYRFFRSALDIIRSSNLPDGSQLGSEVKLVGLDGIDFGNYFYKIGDWYNRATLYESARVNLEALTGKFNQLSGLRLPDGTGLFDPVNIALSESGADASGFTSKLVDWYNHVGLYNQLYATYQQTRVSLQTSLDVANQQLVKLSGVTLPDQTALFGSDNIRVPEVDASAFISKVTQWHDLSIQYSDLKPIYDTLAIGWSTVMDYRLPDGSRFVDNIKFGSIDFTPLINKLNAWYTGNNAFNSLGAIKFSGALANFNLMDMLKNSLGQLNLDGFASRLSETINTTLDNYVIRPVEDFSTQVAVEILKLIARFQALYIRALMTGIYGIDDAISGVYWTLDKSKYSDFLDQELQAFNTVADVLLPGMGFRFVKVPYPTSLSGFTGDTSYVNHFITEVSYAERYTYAYFRSLWNMRPKVKLLVPECYGKAGSWDDFITSAFMLPLDRLLHDLAGTSKGGIQWAGVEFTHDINLVRTMNISGVPDWLKGRDNFFNKWFGSLKLNPFDLTKAWTARPPIGSDSNPQSYIPPQSGNSAGTYVADAPPPEVTVQVSTTTTPAPSGGTTTTTTTTTTKSPAGASGIRVV